MRNQAARVTEPNGRIGAFSAECASSTPALLTRAQWRIADGGSVPTTEQQQVASQVPVLGTVNDATQGTHAR